MKIMQRLYEGIMILLVMFTIMTLWTESAYNSVVNWVVWLVFFIDFIVRLYLSESKWTFMKKNPFLVIAVIPFDQFFQMARIVRIIYLFRIKTITKYYIQPFVNRMTYQSKLVIFASVFMFLIAESLLVWAIEVQVETVWQGLHAVFRHLIFFGHGTMIVEQPVSLWLFVFTSIIGVVLHGIALQWVFSRAESIYESRRQKSYHT